MKNYELKYVLFLFKLYANFYLTRSGGLKEEYERCRLEVNRADEETQFSYQQKRGIAAERKEAKMEKDEAEKYAQLKQELVSFLILYF